MKVAFCAILAASCVAMNAKPGIMHNNTILADLPSFDGYVRRDAVTIDDADGKVSWTEPMGANQDRLGTNGFYAADKVITGIETLQKLCVYAQGCDSFHSSGVLAMFQGTTKTTYLSTSIGTLRDDGLFAVTGTDEIYCRAYVGWDLPANEVKSECDNDAGCHGFIMHNDNSHGDLCKFTGMGSEGEARFMKFG